MSLTPFSELDFWFNNQPVIVARLTVSEQGAPMGLGGTELRHSAEQPLCVCQCCHSDVAVLPQQFLWQQLD